jgi:hypothetical protein
MRTLNKLRERYSEARMHNDQELIEYGAYVAKAHSSSWVRCNACDAFGSVHGAGVTRTAGSVHVVCCGCAREHGYRLLLLTEAVALADSHDERSPVVALDVPQYERAELTHDAKPRTFGAKPVLNAYERREYRGRAG